ncbi:MAG: hypothetical protein JO032_14070 [Alphaproteobacteria bacterium]|nr:hypothetical protein [Alphaproteobacteria bacterium]
MSLSAPISRALALALPVALLGIAYLAILKPVIDTRAQQRDQIEQLGSALARYQRLAQDQKPRQEALDQLRRRAAGQDGLLRGENETLMAAALQNRIKASVGAAHGELKSTQILSGQADGRLRRVAVRAQVTLTPEAALRVFHDLESGEPVLFLDNLDIRSKEETRRRRERVEDGTLDIRFEAYGYAQPQS